MVVPKASRKGKKAWRRNIDTEDVERAFSEKIQRQRQGTAPADLPDNELFYLDQAAQSARPIKSAARKRRAHTALDKTDKAVTVRTSAAGNPVAGPAFDIWSEPSSDCPRKRFKSKQPLPASASGAIRVDRPGSSYNPDPAQQEDVLADAVAVEVTKANQPLLRAVPPPRFTMQEAGDDDELAMLQVEEDAGEEGSEPDDHEDISSVSAAKQRKKTTADRNREKRHRDSRLADAERRRLKQQAKDINGLKALQAQIAADAEEGQRRHQRKLASRAERAAAEPSRLGKLKYLPAPIQVLLSDEVGAGLRSLKAAPVLMHERFNVLQQRGLIEPRLPVRNRKPRKRISYQSGDRAEKARESQAELDALRKKHKK